MVQFENDLDSKLIQEVHKIPGVISDKGTVLHQAFETQIAQVLFKQNHKNKIELDLRHVILLDSQSTMDLFCNSKLVNSIYKSVKKMQLKNNGGTMTVSHKAKIKGYKNDVWFSEDAITNIIALSNLIKQYRVTYDS